MRLFTLRAGGALAAAAAALASALAEAADDAGAAPQARRDAGGRRPGL